MFFVEVFLIFPTKFPTFLLPLKKKRRAEDSGAHLCLRTGRAEPVGSGVQHQLLLDCECEVRQGYMRACLNQPIN